MPPGQGRGGGEPPCAGRRRLGGRLRAQPPEDPSSVSAARSTAIGLLSRRDYPRGALKGRLTEAGFEAGAAEVAVSELEDERLVNDGRFVEAAIASRVGRGQGPLRIALELRQLGVAAALIAAAVDNHSADWTARAQAVRRRRFGPVVPTTVAERTRQARFLLYRGFTADQVRAALGRIAGECFEDLELAADTSAAAPSEAGGADPE